MKHSILVAVVIAVMLLQLGAAQNLPVRVDLFYSPGCPHCAKVIVYLEGYMQEHPGAIELYKYDVSLNSTFFIEKQKEAGVPPEMWGAVPKVFAGNYYCIGDIQCHEELLHKLDEMRNSTQSKSSQGTTQGDINPYQILGLAAVDAVNPCALAVLTLILIAILTREPEKRHRVLSAGIAFTAAIYITYMLYGIVIIHLFKAALNVLSGARLYLYNALGAAALILGMLNIKDLFWYREGGIMTEMPVSWRPRVKKLLSSATSARGSFVLGVFVTLFLLPCTIGPYVITGGILSSVSLLETIPWLVIYNIIFVLPMIAITLIVYWGFATVENVSGWKDRNIRYLHGLAGIIMVSLGLCMILGLL